MVPDFCHSYSTLHQAQIKSKGVTTPIKLHRHLQSKIPQCCFWFTSKLLPQSTFFFSFFFFIFLFTRWTIKAFYLTNSLSSAEMTSKSGSLTFTWSYKVIFEFRAFPNFKSIFIDFLSPSDFFLLDTHLNCQISSTQKSDIVHCFRPPTVHIYATIPKILPLCR